MITTTPYHCMWSVSRQQGFVVVGPSVCIKNHSNSLRHRCSSQEPCDNTIGPLTLQLHSRLVTGCPVVTATYRMRGRPCCSELFPVHNHLPTQTTPSWSCVSIGWLETTSLRRASLVLILLSQGAFCWGKSMMAFMDSCKNTDC